MPRLGKESKGRLWKRLDEAERRARLASAVFEDDTPEKKAARIERAVADPLYFCQTYLPHYFRSAPAVFHADWLDKLVRAVDTVMQAALGAADGVDAKDLERYDSVLACPRGFAKSTVISFGGSLYTLVVKKLPFFLAVCATQAQSEEIVEAINDELESNPLLWSDFGELLASRKPSKYGAAATTKDKCRLQALGWDQGFRGIRYRQWRPMLAIIDDPEKDETIDNDRIREKARRKLTGKVRLAMEPWASLFVVENFIHYDCMSAHIVKDVRGAQKAAERGDPVADYRFRRWHAFVYEARRPDGSSAWPSRFSTEYLDELEEEDPETFALEMMQRAINLVVQAFPRDNVRYYEEEDLRELELLFLVLALDPSKGKTQRSDFSAFILLGAYSDGNAYVREADLQRRSPLTILQHWFQHVLLRQPDISVVETVAFQELLKDVFELMCEERGLYPPVREYNDNAPKPLRIERLERPVNKGVIRFKREHKELVRQLTQFPNGDHDDGPDALEMAWSQVQSLRRSVLRPKDVMLGREKRSWLRLDFEKGAW